MYESIPSGVRRIVTVSSCMLHIFSVVPQCWETQESMSGLFTDQAKVAKYEQQWHSIIFLPCLKKLRVEVSVYICSFYGNEGFLSRTSWLHVWYYMYLESCLVVLKSPSQTLPLLSEESLGTRLVVMCNTPCLLQFIRYLPTPVKKLLVDIRY